MSCGSCLFPTRETVGVVCVSRSRILPWHLQGDRVEQVLQEGLSQQEEALVPGD